jgi:hypothetical protein
MWVWIAVGVGLGAASLLVGLALARALGTIGRHISELSEPELWSNRPMMRDESVRPSTSTSYQGPSAANQAPRPKRRSR